MGEGDPTLASISVIQPWRWDLARASGALVGMGESGRVAQPVCFAAVACWRVRRVIPAWLRCCQ